MFGYGAAAIFDYQIRGTVEDSVAEMFSDTMEARMADLLRDTVDYPATKTTVFSTGGLPSQLEFGFEGLFPIADSFSYDVDVANGEVKGEIIGRRDFGEFEGEAIYAGTFAELHHLTISPNTPDAIACSITPITLPNREDREGDAAWQFICPIGTEAEGTPYRYPITAEMVDNDGNLVTLNGTLWGVWNEQRPPLALALPANIRTALESNPDATQLLAEHQYVSAQYSAGLETTAPHTIKNAGGEVTFYGTVEINGLPFPYQVTTPFIITYNQLTHWGLTHEAFTSFIKEVATLTTTQQLIAAYPNVQLKLAYSTGIEMPYFGFNGYASSGYDSRSQLSDLKMATCGAIPPVSSPHLDTPQYSVRYDFGDRKSVIKGMLQAGNFYPYEATLALGDGVPPVFLPAELNVEVPLTTGTFTFHYHDNWRWVRFGAEQGATENQKIKYQHIAALWGAEALPGKGPQQWLIEEDFTLTITPAGALQLSSCE